MRLPTSVEPFVVQFTAAKICLLNKQMCGTELTWTSLQWDLRMDQRYLHWRQFKALAWGHQNEESFRQYFNTKMLLLSVLTLKHVILDQNWVVALHSWNGIILLTFAMPWMSSNLGRLETPLHSDLSCCLSLQKIGFQRDRSVALGREE